MNTFAENLSVMRKRAGLTQEELADKVNVSVDTIRRWKGDKQEPRLSELKLIAKVLGIKINQLAGNDETENTPNIMQEKIIRPKQSKSSKKGIIIIKHGNTNIEFPATPQGYAILKDKLREISISQDDTFSIET